MSVYWHKGLFRFLSKPGSNIKGFFMVTNCITVSKGINFYWTFYWKLTEYALHQINKPHPPTRGQTQRPLWTQAYNTTSQMNKAAKQDRCSRCHVVQHFPPELLGFGTKHYGMFLEQCAYSYLKFLSVSVFLWILLIWLSCSLVKCLRNAVFSKNTCWQNNL